MNFKYFSQASGKWDLGTQDLSTFEFEIKFRFNSGATTNSDYEILTSETLTSNANRDVRLRVGIYDTDYITVYWGQSSGGTTYTHSFRADPYSWHVLRKFMQDGKLICTLDGNYPGDSTGFIPISTSRSVTLFAQSGYYSGYRPANYKVDVEYIKLNTTTYKAHYINGLKELRDSLGNGLPGSTNSSYPLTLTYYGLENPDMKQVAELTIPEGNVKKIEDSNGDIIWGSQSAFPYRRLEYIQFSGAEYVDTGLTVSNANSYKKWDIKLNMQNVSNWGVNGFDSNNNNRFNIGVNGSGYTRMGVGSGTTYQDADGVALSLNTDYILSLWFNNGSSNLAVYSGDGTHIATGSTVSSSFSSAPGNLYIGAVYYNNVASGFCNEKVYNSVLRLGSSSTISANLIPCQRKSDNVCGLYDTVSQTFKPMQGTSITSGAAGPIADEYWDLTAPS